jgi:hypothetical protein
MVKNWVDNVGDMKHTMHWSSPRLVPLIQSLNAMNFSDLKGAFEYWDSLRVHMRGVADVLFTASCFQIPFVVRMEELFWAFARELLLVKIVSSDDLNLFLSGPIMPQTVIMLGPHAYSLDSHVPPVPSIVTIMGSDLGVDHRTYSQTSILLHTEGLSFQSGVFIQDVTLVHRVSSPQNCAIRVRGVDKIQTNVRLDGVKVIGGGVRFSNCTQAVIHELNIEDTLVGVYANDVDMLVVNPRLDPHYGLVYSDKGFFKLCKTAFYVTKVNFFCCRLQVYRQCMRIYHACVNEKMSIADCDFMDCGKLGQVLGKTHTVVLLYGCYVSSCFC